MPAYRVLFSALLMAGLAASANGASIECPETGKSAVTLPSSQQKLFTAGSSVDISNEIGDLIANLKAENPNISFDSLTNEAVAAYCPVIANEPGFDARQKLSRIKELDALVREKLSSQVMPQGASILAQVPLSEAVYRELRAKADEAGQTPSQYMTALLSKAAGETKGQ